MERGTFRAGQSTLSILRFLESIYYVIWNLDSCIISQRSVFQIVKMIELVLLVLKQSILILRRSRKITIMERTLHSMLLHCKQFVVVIKPVIIVWIVYPDTKTRCESLRN